MNLKTLFLLLIISAPVFAQQVKMSAFTVTTSDTLNEIKNIKIAKPEITAKELAEKGDELISSKGLNFIFSFGNDLCLKAKEAMETRKDKTKPISFNAKINSVDGDIASVVLPEIKFADANCGTCFVEMPMAEFSGKEFVSFIQDRMVRFHTPGNINYENIYLVDPNNNSAISRIWKIPFRAVPKGISDDGKMIILDLPLEELKEIALLIYDDGTFRFYPKAELDFTAKSEIIKETTPSVPGTTLISFSKGEQKQVLRYKNKCP